ncbi:uncharacterized protein LOC143769817 isoform X9 [Ranitomeya variabilis]|uniref:uncharacterized protein LOC143769817 isoform X9 n=1 Tax=Ranitomeya variabilis TaxID=490064 RepID=UPI00405798B1
MNNDEQTDDSGGEIQVAKGPLLTSCPCDQMMSAEGAGSLSLSSPDTRKSRCSVAAEVAERWHGHRGAAGWSEGLCAQRSVSRGLCRASTAVLRPADAIPSPVISSAAMISPQCSPIDSYTRTAITWKPSGCRGFVTCAEKEIFMRFLSTGLSYAGIHLEFLTGRSTISGIVRDTCIQIWAKLHELVMLKPKREDWLKIARGFKDTCDFPHCIGALDGKHIRVLKPPNSGSQFYNYKQFFSVVLLAVVDSHYRFIIVDIGAYGRTGDSRVFNSSIMGWQLRENQLDLPPP